MPTDDEIQVYTAHADAIDDDAGANAVGREVFTIPTRILGLEVVGVLQHQALIGGSPLTELLQLDHVQVALVRRVGGGALPEQGRSRMSAGLELDALRAELMVLDGIGIDRHGAALEAKLTTMWSSGVHLPLEAAMLRNILGGTGWVGVSDLDPAQQGQQVEAGEGRSHLWRERAGAVLGVVVTAPHCIPQGMEGVGIVGSTDIGTDGSQRVGAIRAPVVGVAVGVLVGVLVGVSVAVGGTGVSVGVSVGPLVGVSVAVGVNVRVPFTAGVLVGPGVGVTLVWSGTAPQDATTIIRRASTIPKNW